MGSWQNSNDAELAHDLDTINEIIDPTKVRMTAYQQAVTKSYNKHIKVKQFQVRDWVLRKMFQNTKDPMVRKLAAN